MWKFLNSWYKSEKPAFIKSFREKRKIKWASKEDRNKKIGIEERQVGNLTLLTNIFDKELRKKAFQMKKMICLLAGLVMIKQ